MIIKKIMKLLIICIILIIIVALILCGFIYFYLNNKLKKINYVEIPKSEIQITEGIENHLKGYKNIAIFGLDTIENTYTGSRSDCIIIASINEDKKDIKLVSVYRDTFLKISGYSLDKVNHAYSYGGAALTMSTLNSNMDLDITEFVTVNFESTKEIVDLMGGVEINITNAEAKQIGLDSEGTYNLTGNQALAYGRIRKIDSDYVRTERMRNVVMAVFAKAKKMNVLELNNLADQLLPKVYTNISSSEILSYIPNIYKYSISDSFGWPYITRGKTINGVWYGPPITLESNVVKLHQELFNKEEYIVTDTIKQISKEIIDKTGYSN